MATANTTASSTAAGADQKLKYDIVLDNPTAIYRPGDVLRGRVAIKTQQDLPLDGE